MNVPRPQNHGRPNPGSLAGRTTLPLLAILFSITSCEKPAATAPESGEAAATPTSQANPDWLVTRGDPSLQGRVQASIPRSPAIEWTFDLEGPAMAEAAVSGDLLIVGDIMGKIHGIDFNTRESIWTHETEDTIEAAPAILDDRVFVGSGDNTFLALDLKTGDKLWSVEGDEKFPSAPTVVDAPDDSGKWVLVNGYDGIVRCLLPADGAPVWTYQTNDYINGTPAIVDGSKVAFGGCDQIIHILDLKEGKLINEVATDSQIVDSVATWKDTIFCSTYENQLVATATGAEDLKWIYEAEDFPFSSSPAVAEHRELVYIGSKDKHLHAVGLESGEIAWTFRTGGPIESSPLAFDDAVLFGSNDGRLYAVSHEGEEIWKLDLGEKLTAPPVFARDRIIITGAKGTVFVIR